MALPFLVPFPTTFFFLLTLRNTMTDKSLHMFCLVDGDPISKAFPLAILSTETVGQLRNTIHLSKPIWFKDLEAEDLLLWSVSIPVVPANKNRPILLNEFDSAKELDPTDDVADVFSDTPPKKTIHTIVQRPLPGNADTLTLNCVFQMARSFLQLYIFFPYSDIVHAPIPSRAPTPPPGQLSDTSRPGTPLSGKFG